MTYNKTLSLIQPYATLIVTGAKHNETRSYKVNYRGRLLIHASSTAPIKYVDFDNLDNSIKESFIEEGLSTQEIINKLDRGCIIGEVELVDCIRITEEYIKTLSKKEIAFGDYGIGRYAWVLKNPIKYDKPIIARGYPGLWNCLIEDDILV